MGVITRIDQSKELSQEQKELVSTLAELGRAKAEIFNSEIVESLMSAGKTGSNMTLPVTTVVRKTSEIRAYSSSEAGNVPTEVANGVKKLISGETQGVLNSIGNLVTASIQALFGTTSASEGDIHEYYIGLEGLSIVRLDMKSWYKMVSAESVKKKMERVTVTVGVKSIVDLSQLDFSTFFNLYQNQLSTSGISKDQMKNILAEASDIYQAFIKLHTPTTSKAVINKPPAHLANERLIQNLVS
jgi:hypothetical protein